MDPHDWGRAMALAVTRLAEQLAPEDSEDIHASLVGRDLHLKIRDDAAGVTITVSTAPVPDPARRPLPEPGQSRVTARGQVRGDEFRRGHGCLRTDSR